jgi:hypothetical protein
MMKIRTLGLLTCLVILQAETALAWVFPEHRDIAVLAIRRLSPEQQALLQRLWTEARAGHESRLCDQVAEVAQGLKPDCIDYASWAAISGDHSCSASDMLGVVLDAPWIVGVAQVSARLKNKLAAAQRRDQRINAVRDSDIALQRTDPEYVTRASSNNAHFLLARPSVDMTPLAYAQAALGPNADLNALATYAWFHLRALAEAERMAREDASNETHTHFAQAALADEAFALHFLEDSFAAGHATGSWGNTAVRKGTHDYYSEHGLSLVTWSGKPFVALGDSYMQSADADRAAAAVGASISQLLDAFSGQAMVGGPEDVAAAQAGKFDICHQTHFSEVASREDLHALVPIVSQTPVPALGAGLGELPRFRSELGAFIGLSTALRGGALRGGFGTTQTNVNATGGLDAAVRFGIGLEGILNDSSDGLIFIEVGAREDKHASSAATVPGRGALTGRFRAPFWLFPGDLVLAAPILNFISQKTLMKMAVQAANGGLIPWQAGIATRVGRFQFVLGREVGFSFYRNGSDHPIVIPTPGVPQIGATLISLKSLQVEFPILEYRLFRTFSLNQSSGLMIQPYVGFDKPMKASVVSPLDAPKPSLNTIVTAGVRVVFDWRHYLK